MESNHSRQMVCRKLLAKTIGECCYEECLKPEGSENDNYRITLASEIVYRFKAKRSIWDWLQVEPESLSRYSGDSQEIVSEGKPYILSPIQFLIDAKSELGLTDIVLGNLIQEMQNTLYADVQQAQALKGLKAADLITLPDADLQKLLDGHPKAVANKGRIGWGADDLAKYSPESAEPFQLRYIAARRSLFAVDNVKENEQAANLFTADLFGGMTAGSLTTLKRRFEKKVTESTEFICLPVHPWQWLRHIQTQYAEQVAQGDLIDLGEFGDLYLPQQSIRTLSNVSDPKCWDVKLPLTLLNTSCYRGIPGKHINIGVELSAWLQDLVKSDSLLSKADLVVQKERLGLHCPHPYQKQVAGAPYRFNEMLGVVWRESLSQFLQQSQRGILFSTLFQCDLEGQSLAAEYVRRSGLTAEDWLRRLFRVSTVPLYHLMCAYGIGLVAHGQNISLILENGIPVSASIKDFHGDLRLVDKEFPQLSTLDERISNTLMKLPPNYLIHDLVTGHFVTTLRFISPLFEEQCGVSEKRFYQILAEEIRTYTSGHPELSERYAMFPLFEERISRVCINRVRFRLGYDDTTDRPLPELGQPLINPLLEGFL